MSSKREGPTAPNVIGPLNFIIGIRCNCWSTLSSQAYFFNGACVIFGMVLDFIYIKHLSKRFSTS
ncbi:6647_t:CDS:2, partial [Cetraspora pellucida]